MIPLDGPDIGSRTAEPMPATLLPVVYDRGAGRLFWLDPDRRIVSSPVAADGRTSLAAAAIPLPADHERVDVVATLLHDIAAYTGRPLPEPSPTPPVDRHDEYIVVWVDDAHTRTPRQAAEQAWRTMRRAGSHACVFQVINRRTGARVEIDLLDEPATDPDAGSRS